jgi:hypothetical protein
MLATTGFPQYRGLDITATPETPITELTLDLSASVLPDSIYNPNNIKNVLVTVWFEGASEDQRDIGILDINGGGMLPLTLTNTPALPVPYPHQGRLVLHINVTTYYDWLDL